MVNNMIVQRYKGFSIRRQAKVLRTWKTGYNQSDGVVCSTNNYTVDDGNITESKLFNSVDSAMRFIDALPTK